MQPSSLDAGNRKTQAQGEDPREKKQQEDERDSQCWQYGQRKTTEPLARIGRVIICLGQLYSQAKKAVTPNHPETALAFQAG